MQAATTTGPAEAMPSLELALLARTSTSDNQSPEESLKWQLHRAELATRDVGRIVTIFHDVDESRSVPWKRRPRAQELLAEMRLPRPQRRFDAVVVGEPQRAFGDALQTATIVPLFVHLGIPLYVPELGGAYDPTNDSHDLILGLFGGMSKAERNRIRVRVRSQMVVQAREGRFLGGRPPYGYQLADAGPHPNPAKAADGKRLHRLVPDPIAAPVVARIFDMYLRQNLGIKTIALRLTDEGIPSPSGHDPDRNRHRADAKGAWSRSAVRTILSNPRYLGHQVWHKALGTDVLLDVEDVTLGSVKRLRPNDPNNWVWSAEQVQEPLVDGDIFTAVQNKLAGGTHSRVRRQRGSLRPYVLRGLITCSRCGKRLEGDWRHNRAFYRCRLADPAEYARSSELEVEHPRNAYVREDRITDHIDGWLARLFDPDNIDQTTDDLAPATVDDDAESLRAELAQRRLDDADTKIARYKAALEAGTDPSLIAQWISEAQAARTAALAELASIERPEAVSVEDIEALIADLHETFGDMRTALGQAEGAEKAELLTSLGVSVSFDPVTRTARVTCTPQGLVRGRVGGVTPPRFAGLQPCHLIVYTGRASERSRRPLDPGRVVSRSGATGEETYAPVADNRLGCGTGHGGGLLRQGRVTHPRCRCFLYVARRGSDIEHYQSATNSVVNGRSCRPVPGDRRAVQRRAGRAGAGDQRRAAVGDSPGPGRSDGRC